MILHDPYAMHRPRWRWDWEPDEHSRDWTLEDFVLADVFQVIEDYTNPSNGMWRPYDESGDVWFDVKSSFSGYDAAIEKEQERRGDKGLKPGESLYAVPVFNDDLPRPTLDSWAKDLDSENAGRRPSNLANARPPTIEELQAMGLG